MLHPGLYERVVNNTLNSELAEIPEARKALAPIDQVEASKVLAQYFSNAAISNGLEWNVKTTRQDLPETMDIMPCVYQQEILLWAKK